MKITMNTLFGIPSDTLLLILTLLLGIILLIVAYGALRYPLPFKLGLRNLRRRKSQTTLIIAGLALSTVIITSALGIGDTVSYSVSSEVYQQLGAIDQIISLERVDAGPGFGFGSAPQTGPVATNWFGQESAQSVAGVVDGEIIDGSVPAAFESLPVLNTSTNLSEPSVEIRGLGEPVGDGLVLPVGFNQLAGDEILINESLASALDAGAGDGLLLAKDKPTPVIVAGVVDDGELAGFGPAIIWSLEKSQTLFEQQDKINTILISNAGDEESGVNMAQEAAERLRPAVESLVVNNVKVDRLAAAEGSAEFITTLFVTFGTFSIFSGILLIFLIFSVLAAERKPELGMGRAVGMQRSDLVRQFVNEGLGYSLVAALIGALLGVAAALLLAGTISRLLGAADIEITPRVSPQSAMIGFSLGLVVTFIMVTVSAVRISRINIIAAIRDLNLPELPREAQWTMLLHPFKVWQSAVQKAQQGNRRESARLFLLAGPKAVLNFWIGLLARGPVLLALGYLFAWTGANIAEQAGVYGLGVSLFIIGLGQLAAWLWISPRIAYSLVGLGLVLYWTLPTREIGRLAELNTNPGDFFISGIFLVGGAIMLFLYNADTLLNLFAGLLGRFGRLLPVARVAIAYPVKAKGRTATTLAMFSLVVFTLVGTTTITNTFSNFLNSESGSGGYDILIRTNPFNPLSQDDFEAAISQLGTEEKLPESLVIASAVSGPVQAKSPTMDLPSGYLINGVDEEFLSTNTLELANIADGYEDTDEVWAALAADPTAIVIDNFSIDRTGDPTFQPEEGTFLVSSIDASDAGFEPVTIEISGDDGGSREFTIIGVLGSAPSFYGALMNRAGAAELGFTGTNKYYLRLNEADDARQAANLIESVFPANGLQTTLIKEQLDEGRQAIRSIFYLIQGFIGLGLLLGIAALGVITIRAVVERRQQIGVLRAIGFQQAMVQAVFLFEGIFIAGLGTLIGYILALAFAYNLYLQVAADQGLAFLPPWPTLIIIAVSIVLASILTTWLPARATANITIADALRYE